MKKISEDEAEKAILESAGIWSDKKINSGAEYQDEVRKKWRRNNDTR